MKPGPFNDHAEQIALNVGLLIVGLVILGKGADVFVLAAARLAVTLRLSPVVVGAVVIGFGTGAPELLVSSLAAARGSLDIAAGNVVGSNLANLTLVLGVAGVIARPETVRVWSAGRQWWWRRRRRWSSSLPWRGSSSGSQASSGAGRASSCSPSTRRR